jgi:hypothetical protein
MPVFITLILTALLVTAVTSCGSPVETLTQDESVRPEEAREKTTSVQCDLSAESLEIDSINGKDLQFLTEMSNLTDLSVDLNKDTADGLRYIGRCTRLQRLKLEVSEPDAAALQELGKLKHLKYLEYSGDGPLEFIRNLSELEELRARPKFESDLKAIAHAKSLKSVNFYSTIFDPAALMHLGSLPVLEKIYLDHAAENETFGPDWSGNWAKGLAGLKSLRSLRELDVSNDYLDSAAIREIGKCTGLRKLRMPGAQLNNRNVASLRNLKQLLALDITGTHLGDNGIRTLVGVLPNLSGLALGETKVITDRGVRYLELLPKLRVLSLGHSWSVSDGGLVGLVNCRHLEQLNLYGSDVRGTDLSALRKLPKLRKLRAGRIKNETLGGMAGSETLQIFETWAILNDEGVKALNTLPNLVSLTYERNECSQSGLRLLTELQLRLEERRSAISEAPKSEEENYIDSVFDSTYDSS